MKRATITEVKNGLSALLDEVRAGESILVLDRGIPIATIEPVTKRADVEGRIERLTRAGLVRPPTAPFPVHLFDRPLPKTRDGSSVLEALLEERRTGR